MNRNEKNVDLTINFLNALNSLPNKYTPLKKIGIISNLKQNLGLLLVFKNQSLSKTNLKKFMNKNETQIKAEFHEKFKTSRNLSTFMRESKQFYYTKYFEK